MRPVFLPGRPQHHKLYYALFNIPTLITICLRPRELRGLLHELLILGFLAFLIWSLISLFWSPLDENIGGLINPPLYTLMLFIGCVLLVRYCSEYLQPLFFWGCRGCADCLILQFVRVRQRLLSQHTNDRSRRFRQPAAKFPRLWLFLHLLAESEHDLHATSGTLAKHSRIDWGFHGHPATYSMSIRPLIPR